MHRILAVLVALTLLSTATARAQEAEQPPARDMDQVIVTTSTRPEPLRGYLVRLGPEMLTLTVDGSPVDVPVLNVLRIDTRKDSLKNGAIIGALIMGGLCALNCGDGGTDKGFWIWATSINAVFGAAIGAGIDAAHVGRTPIYRRPDSSASVQGGRRLAFSSRFRF